MMKYCHSCPVSTGTLAERSVMQSFPFFLFSDASVCPRMFFFFDTVVMFLTIGALYCLKAVQKYNFLW